MQVLPQCGHAVHEDAPDKVSPAEGLKLDKSLSLQIQCRWDLLLTVKQRLYFRSTFWHDACEKQECGGACGWKHVWFALRLLCADH